MRLKSLACLVLVVFVTSGAWAQRKSEPKGNFIVVVGAFTTEQHASVEAQRAIKQRLPAEVELNPDKNLYYVIVLRTDDHDAARAEARRLQAGSFKDAWVFSRKPVVEPVAVVEEKPKEEIKPIVEEVVPVVVKPQRMTPADSARLVEERIKAEVEKRSMTLKKGNTETLDYIFFYNDAAVLRPESRFAVDKLVQIMKENPSEKIRIHGHTNGNDPGKIIKMGNSSTDFFSLNNTVEDQGSAKRLSELRATTIRDYLVVNGIDKKRMSIKAWGGKKPLYKVDDPKAEANVRVEIEVIPD